MCATAFAQAPVIEDPGNIFPGSIELLTDTKVGIQIVASGNPTSYDANNLPSGLSLDQDTGYIDGQAKNPTAGPVTVTFMATNADGTGSFDVQFEIFERQPSLPIAGADKEIEDALDVNGSNMIVFTQSPNNTLIGQKQDFFYRIQGAGVDNDVARNNQTGPYTTSGVRAYVMGPCVIEFTWWGLIESNYDFFSFYVDQDPVPPFNPGDFYQDAGHHPTDFITGTVLQNDAAAQFSKVLGPGLHRLEWLYTKDYNDLAGGGNKVFLDNVRVTGYPEWAASKNLSPFESGLAIDKERDGNPLLVEYALDLNPKRSEYVMPMMSFEPDGRAILQVEYDDDAFGVTVDIEKSTLLTPGSWATSLEILPDDGKNLVRREISPQTDGYYRVKVSSP